MITPPTKKETAAKADKMDSPKDRMILALTKSLGVVSTAANKANIARSAHYEWLTSDPEYKAKVEDIKNLAIDFVESKMFNQIKSGDTALIKYFLSTQGKNRGYVERQEIANTNKDGEDIPPAIINVYSTGPEMKSSEI